MRRPGSVLPGPGAAVLALLLACLLPAAAAERHGFKVCPSMDIRNSAEQLLKLRNCTVIEGQLSIVLMERTTPMSFENLTFPELREVTGYIKIYRMKGIRNLGYMFPNLSVVRGISLYRDYAIVIYDNEDLMSLGLRSLKRVERGSVRIERNDRLCYAHTIDWGRIVADGENVILRRNYDTRLCGLCPDSEVLDNGAILKCPADNTGKLLCWDERHCQTFCPASCGSRACGADGSCCHAACAGGCDGPLDSDCHVCKYFSLGHDSTRRCLTHCPDNTYELYRRCVSEQECRSMAPPNELGADGPERFYKIFNGTCVFNCPNGYMQTGLAHNATCKRCPDGGCLRECPGARVDSLAATEQLRGCTHIKGSLEISLRAGGNIMAALESNLGEIREIEGHLKVVRSNSLVSLGFLKNLRKIGGNDKSGQDSFRKPALHIFTNQNLELLWNWTEHGAIDIAQGKLFIHFNPKLCYELLKPLQNMTRDPESTFGVLEVSPENNGDQALCSKDTLNLQVSILHRRAVVLKWNNYCLEDVRKLLGYSIYYIVAEHNITQYEKRDACYDAWSVIDVTMDEVQNNSRPEDHKLSPTIGNPCSNMQPLFHPLTQLTPYTRYAVYVKTFTTLQDKRGAQSPIIYFKTLPGTPSKPQNLIVENADPHKVNVKWSPPALPNGRLEFYHIQVHAHIYNKPTILEVNYCRNPSGLANLKINHKEESNEKKKYPQIGTDNKEESCKCAESGPKTPYGTRFTSQLEADHADSIAFENALQNEVYVKSGSSMSRPKSNKETGIRSRRSVEQDNSLVIMRNFSNPTPHRAYMNETDEDGYFKTLFYEVSSSTTNLTVDNLRHYTWYTIAVWACRQRDVNDTDKTYYESWCSLRVDKLFRTSDLENADAVRNVHADITAANKTQPEVIVMWEPPTNPNGMIIAYDINYARQENTAQASDMHSCMRAEEFESQGRTYLMRNLAPGNYSVKITPVSVFGPGNVSKELFVYIPERGAAPHLAWIWGVAGAAAALALLGGAALCYVRRGLLLPHDANKLFASVNPEYVATVYVPDDWEVPRAAIDLVRELGQGSFGMVYEGIAKNIIKGQAETRCAVKTVNEHATDRERIEFLNEASVMKAFDTSHVVRLLGVVSRGQPTLVVMELMECGDLKSYLRSHRPDDHAPSPEHTPPTLQQIQQMAIEIADGMAYLSAKKFVHRDLAARNCMVAGDLTVKVGDFGMTRDIYETDYYRKGTKGLLPVRWMSPESLKDGVFSSNSDVWSYGVVLWEMATLAMQPYQGLSNEQVLRYVVEGGVMERPEHCPDRLYELMRACWAHKPAARPSFLRLVASLAPTAAPVFRHRSFFHSQHGQELYAHQRITMEDEGGEDVFVGAVATGSGSNLFGVSGRLASWVREMSSLRSRRDDAAAEPLAPRPATPTITPALPPPNKHSNGHAHSTTPC